MPQLIDVLPGIPLPISAVNQTLRHMWDVATDAGEGGEPRAMQLNLVLHFGDETSSDEATECFDAAIQFAQRYPCRVIVLCPTDEANGEEMRGKLFSQCYLGPNLRDVCCCEAIIVSHRDSHDASLENQVSLWLESDLPVYHWLHRVPAERIKGAYLAFLKRSTRIVYDRQVEGDRYARVSWPNPNRIRDLAYARSLPMRQNFGQFLSGFPEEGITSNFDSAVVTAQPDQIGAARGLAAWMRDCLVEAFDRQGKKKEIEIPIEQAKDPGAPDIATVWHYNDHHRFLHWSLEKDSRTGHVSCNFGSGKIEQPFHLERLERAGELGEALFF
ncbi:MAG: hypothetical protein E1N59_2048 [Puniceicoccaceae bacterium 5H]|nr:MAG: hypothetical protein E1N59_2048 [Puniceicoccaceae bacterium 5H]